MIRLGYNLIEWHMGVTIKKDIDGNSGLAKFLPPLLVAAAAFAVYAHTIGFGFVFDEQILIAENPAVVHPEKIFSILTEKFWPGPVRGIYYRPVTTLTYALGHLAAGPKPWFQHLLNVVFHTIASVLVFYYARGISKNGAVGFMAGVLFAVHPVHTESVAWVPGRTDVLAFALLLSAKMSLWESRRSAGGRRAGWLAFSSFLFLASLGAKEIAIVFPVLVIAQDFVIEGRKSRGHIGEYALMVAIAGLYMVWRTQVLGAEVGAPPAPDPLEGVPFLRWLVVGASIFGHALAKIIYPHPWLIDYAYEENILAMSTAALLLYSLALVGAAAVFIIFRKKMPVLSYCSLSFVICVLPVSHLVPFPTLFAERFLYLPSLFVAIAISELVFHTGEAWGKTGKKLVYIVAACLVLILSVHTVARNMVFKSELTFWREATMQVPDKAVARNWLGIAYRNRGMWHRAETQYREAIRLDPDFHVARMNLSEALMRTGREEKAEQVLRELTSLDPENPDYMANLGVVMSMRGKWDEASTMWKKALDKDPTNFTANIMLAEYYLRIEHDREQALRYLASASRARPGHPQVERLTKALQKR